MAVLLLNGLGPFPLPRAWAADLESRSITLSDAEASANNVTYKVAFSTATTGPIGSVRIQFCSNTSLVDDSCFAPAGFDDTPGILATQTGMTGFTIWSGSTANELILTRPPANETPVAATFEIAGITNPTANGSLFARIFTYPTSDGSGPYTDAGGLALYILPSFGINTTVPPYLKFCVGESIAAFDCTTATEAFTNLGTLTSLVTSAAQTQMVVATNADNGYSMSYVGGTMTSGSNTIAPMAVAGPSTTGTGQFGLNLRANTAPVVGQDVTGSGVGGVTASYNTPNQYIFSSGDTLATAGDPDDNRKYTVSYIINIPSNQPGGVYSTTLTYIAIGKF